MSKHGAGFRDRMGAHVLQIDRADLRQREMLDRLLAECDPGDPVTLDFRGDRVVLSFRRHA